MAAKSSIPLLGVSGDQYRQHAGSHPFQHQSYLEALRKSGGPIVRMGTAVAAAVDPTGRILYPPALQNTSCMRLVFADSFREESYSNPRRNFRFLPRGQPVSFLPYCKHLLTDIFAVQVVGFKPLKNLL